MTTEKYIYFDYNNDILIDGILSVESEKEYSIDRVIMTKLVFPVKLLNSLL